MLTTCGSAPSENRDRAEWWWERGSQHAIQYIFAYFYRNPDMHVRSTSTPQYLFLAIIFLFFFLIFFWLSRRTGRDRAHSNQPARKGYGAQRHLGPLAG